MKRIVIYITLSAVLMVPITAIIVLSILTQPDTGYSEQLTDDSSLATDTVKRETVEEVMTCQASFDSGGASAVPCAVPEDQTALPAVEEGDPVKKGDLLCSIGSRRILAENSGIVEKIRDTEGGLLFVVKSDHVDRLRIRAPIELYPKIRRSACTLTFNGKTYHGKYLEAERIAAEDNTFSAFYRLSGKGFLLYGRCPVALKTGRRKAGALTVRKECVRVGEDRSCYVEVAENGEIRKVPVEVGITGEERVEIIPQKDEDVLSEGMEAVLWDRNELDIPEEKETAEKIEEGEEKDGK